MERKIIELAWEITDRCNYNCVHCYNPRHREDLSYEEILGILKDAKRLGVEKIKYGGGEPLLREDFLKILKKTIDYKFDVTFSTNGFVVEEKLVKKIKETGLKRIQISLDGNLEIHNKIRKNPLAYEKAINAIQLFVNNNFKVSVATTLIKKNLNQLGNIFKICEELGVNRWRVMKYIPCSNKDLVPTPKEYLDSHITLLKLKEHSSRGLEVFVAREFDEILCQENQDRLDFSCFGGRSVMSIKSNGDASPCSYFPEYVVGNLKNSPLIELWNSEKMKNFSEKPFGDIKCKHYLSCGGGCKAAKFYLNKKKCDPYCWVKIKD